MELYYLGYVHTITFSHRFLLFGSKLELPWDCGTIENDAKTLPCARSLKHLKAKMAVCIFLRETSEGQ